MSCQLKCCKNLTHQRSLSPQAVTFPSHLKQPLDSTEYQQKDLIYHFLIQTIIHLFSAVPSSQTHLGQRMTFLEVVLFSDPSHITCDSHNQSYQNGEATHHQVLYVSAHDCMWKLFAWCRALQVNINYLFFERPHGHFGMA